MKIAIASDHAGFKMKSRLIRALAQLDIKILDLGTNSQDPVDYPDFAQKLAKVVQSGEADRGLLICGSGVGASVAANKFQGIRAGLCHDSYSAHQGVEHDAMNILVMGSRVIGQSLAEELVITFLKAAFSGEERHVRRLSKIEEIEWQSRARRAS